MLKELIKSLYAIANAIKGKSGGGNDNNDSKLNIYEIIFDEEEYPTDIKKVNDFEKLNDQQGYNSKFYAIGYDEDLFNAVPFDPNAEDYFNPNGINNDDGTRNFILCKDYTEYSILYQIYNDTSNFYINLIDIFGNQIEKYFVIDTIKDSPFANCKVLFSSYYGNFIQIKNKFFRTL